MPVGFVCGALGASLVNLPDIVSLNRLIAGSGLVAAMANLVLLAAPRPTVAISARIVTGAALAGVYPPVLKLVSTWFRHDRGLALGIIIGALTVGSSMPHLFRGLAGGIDWRPAVLASTLATIVGSQFSGNLGTMARIPLAGPSSIPDRREPSFTIAVCCLPTSGTLVTCGNYMLCGRGFLCTLAKPSLDNQLRPRIWHHF